MKDDPNWRLGYGIFSVSDKRFEPAMRVHDFAYIAGSHTQQTMTRKEVDDIFLDFMLHLAKDEDPIREQAAIARAYTYYGLARAWGWLFWEGPQPLPQKLARKTFKLASTKRLWDITPASAYA